MAKKGNTGKQVKPPASRGKVSNGGKGGFKTDDRNRVEGASRIKATPPARTQSSYRPQRIVSRGSGRG